MNVLRGGAFGVEFFFLVSGYLMMQSIERFCTVPSEDIGDETLAFIKKKLSTFYPEVIISLTIAFLVQCITKRLGAWDAIKLACESVFEFLLLSHSGLGTATLNSVIWYLSTMLLAMMILYPLLRKHRNLMVKVLMPLSVIFVLGFLDKNYEHFRSPDKWLFIAYKGFFRGMAELCLGAELYVITKNLKNANLTRLGQSLVTSIKWICWGALFLYMTKASAKYDALMLGVFSVAISCAFSGKSLEYKIYQNNVVFFLGRFSLPVYLNHQYWAKHLNYILPDNIKRIEALGIYTVVSVFTAVIVMMMASFWRKNKNRISLAVRGLLLIE